jgi:uncharacterized ion transporter superfamily protein YfcC
MYEDTEIDTSYKYLKNVISQLEEPVCILGGWVFSLVLMIIIKNSSKECILDRGMLILVLIL